MNQPATRIRGHENASETRDVMTICHDVNSSMATIVLCIEFLAGQLGRDDAPAVIDAHVAIDTIVDRMEKLRELSQQVRVEAAGSGVFRT